MTTYSASARVEGGMLHTSRPITAPAQVTDLVDRVVYDLANGDAGPIVSVELVVDTSGESDTPIGDSVQGTSSTPLDPADDPADDEPQPAATVAP